MPPTTTSIRSFGNLQSPLVRPYRRRFSRHALLSFPDNADARGFVRELLPLVTDGELPLDPGPPVCISLGLSAPGLKRMGQSQSVIDQLDPVFQEGPEGVPLGDSVGSSSDQSGWWERQFPTDQVDGLVQVYAKDEESFRRGTDRISGLASKYRLLELKPRRNGTFLDGRSLSGGRVHFGYKDGISQPDIAWNGAPSSGQSHFNQFVLGYSNEAASSSPSREPLAGVFRDSSYLVLRWVYQDVAAFNRFLRDQAPALAPTLAPDSARELLAAKLIGRWRDGSPLVLTPDRPDPALANATTFGFRDDAQGLRCPFSAHIRVSNPRDQELDPVAQLGGVPRLIRRGVPYGAELPADQVEDDGIDRGLIGVFLCSNILRQFYTLTRWIRENSFSPVFAADLHAQDPLFGNRQYPGASRTFRVPTSTGAVTISGLLDFVRTKGTAFFLLPSISALRSFSS